MKNKKNNLKRPMKVKSVQSSKTKRVNSEEYNKEWSNQTKLLLGERESIAKNAQVSIRAVKLNEADKAAKISQHVKSQQNQLNQLKAWHESAHNHLQELIKKNKASKTGTIERIKNPELFKNCQNLIIKLRNNALKITKLEGAQSQWHAAIKSSQEAIHIGNDISKQAIGKSLPPSSVPYLKRAQATFMLEGNSPSLRNSLAIALNELPKNKSGSAAYWLSRYQLIAGNYVDAYKAMQFAPDYPRIRDQIRLIVDSTADAPAWIAYPCNFYTYRYTLVEDDSIRQIMSDLFAQLKDGSDSTLDWSFDTYYEQIKANIKRITGGRFRGPEDPDYFVNIAILAMNCYLLWNQANHDMDDEKYSSASRNYADCQKAILTYFSQRYPGKYAIPSTQEGVYSVLVRLTRDLIRYTPYTMNIWNFFRTRYMSIALDELYDHDWVRPTIAPEGCHIYDSAEDILKAIINITQKIEEKTDAPLLAMALIFVPLGIAESSRLRRDFDTALHEARQILNMHNEVKILSEFIEKPFIKILIAQTLLEKADSEYKARSQSNCPARNSDGSLKFQGLEAAETYQKALLEFQDQGDYITNINSGIQSFQNQTTALLTKSFHPLTQKDASGNALQLLSQQERIQMQLLGKEVPIPGIVSRTTNLPGYSRLVGPHEPLLCFEPPPGQGTLRETNPLIYVIVTEAKARLLQLDAGLNYLGYSDDYVPPWRFQFLLSRARYYTDHAKNAQQEYLNFLQNAEREEYQEMSVAQSVVLEKSSVRVENSRVDQSRLELEASKQSKELADLVKNDATTRASAYEDFCQKANEKTDDIIGDDWKRETLSAAGGALSDASAGASAGAILGSVIPGVGTAIGAAAGAAVGGLIGLFSSSAQESAQDAQLAIACYQREYEQTSLNLACAEAAKSAGVAQAQLDISSASLTVATLQRATALMRHEFAVQNLTFLRNCTFSAELWYRLAHLLRGVSEKYLRYAVELAFLSEQAYEFEADKRINVIRFDYDVSEIGGMLAADFLSADLDTLEQDLMTTQTERLQPVRYVLSLAHEFPETLEDLRDNGSTIFTLTLEKLERRFPGLYNLRIGAVEVMPLALMDPTRFSIELTYLGTSRVRLKAQPDSPQGQASSTNLNITDLVTDDPAWPIKVRVGNPETAVYSGLTRAEQDAVFSFTSANQRGAFENLGAAASWQLDMSMKENQVVPGSLLDILITFDISGYYDPNFRSILETKQYPNQVLTQWFSAQRSFHDAFYAFNQKAVMEWDITPEMISLVRSTSVLRNVGVVLSPSADRADFGQIMGSYSVKFTIDQTYRLQISSLIPQITFTLNKLNVTFDVVAPRGSTFTWDFGDGGGWQSPGGKSQQYTYSKPGKYKVGLRIVSNNELSEYQSSIIVSTNNNVCSPLTVFPSLSTNRGDGSPQPQSTARVVLNVQVPAGESVTIVWKIKDKPAIRGTRAQFDLVPGDYVLSFTAIRDLTGQLYCTQRYLLSQKYKISALRILTNRTWDPQTGQENTQNSNVLTSNLFSTGDISPADKWTLTIPLAHNPFLTSVTPNDIIKVDLSELGDSFLTMEYEVMEK